ncbi:HYR domain-containing protein, partial [Salinimicrobium sp. WS361]|uniref:HYR domain-containing protein n=1 Tax=Salinimicrobium sp. WS361 TaxID=3425123 RepID=UPI003D6FAE97
MEKYFTPVKIWILFLLVGSPVLGAFWSSPDLKSFSYPQPSENYTAPWYESPKGIFALGFNDNTENATVTAPADVQKRTDSGKCSASINIPEASFTGNSLTWSMSGATSDSGTGQVGTHTFEKGVTTIVFTSIGDNSSTDQDSMTVTIKDEEAPEINVGSNISKNTDNGKCTASIAIPNVSFSDNCSGETLSWTMTGVTSGNGTGQVGTKTFNIGKTTINYTVTDAAGLKASGAVDITVTDDEAPEITLGNDIFESTDTGKCTASIAISNVNFSDNCSGETLSWTMSGVTSGNGTGQVGTKTFNIGKTTINYTVTDAAGLTASGTIEITVTDNEAPKITLGNDIFESTDTGKCTAAIAIPNVSFSDNCSGENLSWTMSGVTSGNGTGQVGTKTFNIGKTTINYTVTDTAGLTASGAVEITVTDDESPEITLGNDIFESTDSGQCTASIAIPNVSFSDNCSGETLSWTMTGVTSGNGTGQVGTKTFSIGKTTINYTVTDAAGLTASGAVDITVTDNEAPKITLGNDIFESTDTGQCTASIAIPNVSFSDNCSGETLSWTMSGVTSGNGTGQVGTKTFSIGKTTISYTVTDAAGLTASGAVDITVTDNEAPKITLGNDIFESTDTGKCTASIAIPNVSFSDNCSGEILSWTMSGVTSGNGTGQIGTKTFSIGKTT